MYLYLQKDISNTTEEIPVVVLPLAPLAISAALKMSALAVALLCLFHHSDNKSLCWIVIHKPFDVKVSISDPLPGQYY